MNLTTKEQINKIQEIIISMETTKDSYYTEQVQEALILLDEFSYIRNLYDQSFEVLFNMNKSLFESKMSCDCNSCAQYDAELEAAIKMEESKLGILDAKQNKILNEVIAILENKKERTVER